MLIVVAAIIGYFIRVEIEDINMFVLKRQCDESSLSSTDEKYLGGGLLYLLASVFAILALGLSKLSVPEDKVGKFGFVIAFILLVIGVFVASTCSAAPTTGAAPACGYDSREDAIVDTIGVSVLLFVVGLVMIISVDMFAAFLVAYFFGLLGFFFMNEEPFFTENTYEASYGSDFRHYQVSSK